MPYQWQHATADVTVVTHDITTIASTTTTLTTISNTVARLGPETDVSRSIASGMFLYTYLTFFFTNLLFIKLEWTTTTTDVHVNMFIDHHHQSAYYLTSTHPTTQNGCAKSLWKWWWQ